MRFSFLAIGSIHLITIPISHVFAHFRLCFAHLSMVATWVTFIKSAAFQDTVSKQVQSLTNSISPSAIRNIAQQYEQLASSMPSPATIALSRQLLQQTNLGNVVSEATTANQHQGIIADVVDAVYQAIGDDEVEIEPANVDYLFSILDVWIQQLPKGYISANAALNITAAVVTLLTLYVQMLDYESGVQSGVELEHQTVVMRQHLEEEKTGNELLKTVINNQEELIHVSTQLLEDTRESKDELYFARHESVVRREPSRSGTIISRLYSDQLVQQFHREGNWIQVSFFDYELEELQTGWVNCRNLTRAEQK